MIEVIALILLKFLLVLSSPISLEKLSTIYLPYGYNASVPLFRYTAGSVEQMSYDSDNYIVYVVGGNILHVIDIKNVTSPRILHNMTFDNVDITDIDFCGGDLFVTIHNLNRKRDGKVIILNRYTTSKEMKVKYNVTVGTHPDMLVVTKDCKKVLVALEAEPYLFNGTLIDPEGGIGIIKIGDVIDYKFLNFREYNTRWKDLEPKGLNFVYRGNNNTFANDVEPEYIAFNKDQTKAYICLQENNAIAVLDMASETIEDIIPLGFKSWEKFRLDASNKDGGINIRPWPVYGMYQPDGIQVFEVGGKGYLVTANEGDSKGYAKFKETSRVSDIVLSENSSVLEWANKHNMSGTIQDKKNLGRLEITTLRGRNEDNSYESLYSFGGRGFSIWSIDTMELVYDSGSQFEDLHKQYYKELFNTNGGKSKKTIAETFDSRSDDKGPECESVKVATIGNQVVIFVGSERPGSVTIFAIENDVTKPQFQSIWVGIDETNGTWEEIYNRRKLSEIDPEDIHYISPNKSPTGDHMLMVAGAVSGTVSLFSIKTSSEQISSLQTGENNAALIRSGSVLIITACLVLMMGVLKQW